MILMTLHHNVFPLNIQRYAWLRSDIAEHNLDQGLHCLPFTQDFFRYMYITSQSIWLIVLGFNDTSTLEGHFVSSPREREKRDRRESRGDEREGQGRKRNRNESEETEETRILRKASSHLLGQVTGATIRTWLLNKFISFLAVLTWKTGLKKM